MAKINKNYVDNKMLEKALRCWVNDVHICYCLDRRRPKIPEYVGLCILKIIWGLASRQNFSSYSYKDEMVGDAVAHVCTYLHGFNALKGTAFNFISFAAYNSFSARIKIEHRQMYYKNKNLEFMTELKGLKDSNGDFVDPGLQRMMNDSATDFAQKIIDYETKFKPKKKLKKLKATHTKGLFRFIKKGGN